MAKIKGPGFFNNTTGQNSLVDKLGREESHSEREIGSCSITLPVYDALLALINVSINITNRGEVLSYLTKNVGIENIVLSICEDVKDKFSGKTKVYLEIYHDPEIEDEFLVLYIRQKNYSVDIMARIEEINQEHERELSQFQGLFYITTDFKEVD